MRLQRRGNSTHQGIHRWMKVALFGTITIELCLMLDYLIMQQGERIFSSVQNVAHILSLSLLALLVALLHVHQTHLARLQKNLRRQTEASLSLLTTVKHELNNDMQVVVGNAELAEILMESGGDVKKTISNIVGAASAAIVRIDQLSVFNMTNQMVKTAVDLNAILRQSAARLTKELPNKGNVRLELACLPERILVDGRLFTLSLTNLIFRGAQYMETGYEIVLRTDYSPDAVVGSGSVSADISFMLQGATSDQLKKCTTTALNIPIKALLSDSAALIDLSGAASVRHDCSSYGAQISMQFTGDSLSAKSHVHSNVVCDITQRQ
jgi:signal transduction histidine kinase